MVATILIAAALVGYSVFVVVRKIQRRKKGCARSAKNFELVLRWKAVSDTIKLTFMHGIQEVRKYGKIFWYGWIPR